MSERRSSRILEVGTGLPRAFDPRTDDAAEGADPVDEAYHGGYEQGFVAGQRAAAKKFEPEIERFRGEIAGSLQRLAELREQLTHEHESSMIELALEAASRIVRERIAGDDPVAARALREAIDALPGGSPVQARLHPDDIAAVRRDLGDEIGRLRLELLPDDSLSRGGCVVESAAGVIDATLESAVDAVAAAAGGRQESS